MGNDNRNSRKTPRKSDRQAREQLKLDQIFRVLFKLSKKVTVQLINGLFNESFISREVTIHYSNGEFINDDYGRIVGDMFITVETKQGKFTYHIEFQTLNDESMVIRMFRYGFEKAVEEVQASGTLAGHLLEKTVVTFPQQLVIFLEENEAISDSLSFTLRLPDGHEVDYTVSVMKYWTYTAETLKSKHLYSLLPLLVFGSRKRMKMIYESNRSETEKSRLITEQFEQVKENIQRTVDVLGELHDKNEIYTGDLERILRVMHNITEYLYSRYGEYRLIDKEVLHMVKTLFDPRIKEEGKREGKEVGKKEGKEEGKKEVAQNLLSMGVDIKMIVKATGLTMEEIMQLSTK